MFPVSFEELYPPESKERKENLDATKAALEVISGSLDKNGEGKMFVMGDSVSFADFWLSALLVCAKMSLQSQEWEELATRWNGGRWGKYVAAFEQWEGEPQGEEEVYRP
jgi:glutathione S-transferase